METNVVNEDTLVTENLKKKRTLRSKISYILFAYQGVLLASVLVLLFAGGLGYALLTQKTSVLTVRVLSKDISYENVVTQLDEKYSEIVKPSEKETVDVQNLDLGSEKNQDVMVAQLAAHDVDLLVLTEEMDKEMTPLFKKNQIEKGSYTYTDSAGRTFVSRIPGKIPNAKNLEKIIEQ